MLMGGGGLGVTELKYHKKRVLRMEAGTGKCEKLGEGGEGWGRMGEEEGIGGWLVQGYMFDFFFTCYQVMIHKRIPI